MSPAEVSARSRVLLIHICKSAYHEVTFSPLGKCIQSCTEIILFMFEGFLPVYVWFSGFVFGGCFLFRNGIKLWQLMQGKRCLQKPWILIPATGFQQQVIWLNDFLAQPPFLRLFSDENSLKST